jgi:hypothetical protein
MVERKKGGKNMIQVIKRCNCKNSKEQLPGSYFQVSFNSDGRLVLRSIINNDNDSLIVLDPRASQKVIDFCQKVIRNNETKQYNIKICNDRGQAVDFDDLPF